MRYYVLPAEEPEPRCPLAVVRAGGGTEQSFTRESRREPSSTGLGRLLRRDAWRVDADWAEVFVIDMIRGMRGIRYGDSDPSVRMDRGVWGSRRTQPLIDLGDGEATLVRRAPEPFRWFVPEPGEGGGIPLRVAEDGTAHRFTL